MYVPVRNTTLAKPMFRIPQTGNLWSKSNLKRWFQPSREHTGCFLKKKEREMAALPFFPRIKEIFLLK